MMTLKEIRGKKANEVRWEALRMLDWNKDADVIQYIFGVTNGRYFSSRTPEQVVADARGEVEFWNNFRAQAEKLKEEKYA